MASGQEKAALQCPHQGTAEGERGEVIPQWHPDSANGARPEHGTLARREYGILAPEELAGNPDAEGSQGSWDIPKDTTGTGVIEGKDTGMGE